MLPASLSRSWRRYSPVVLLTGVVAGFVWVHVRAEVEYGRIEYGMTRAQVFSRLGEPRRSADNLVFCMATVRWTGTCPETEFDGSYLYYKYGVARWVIVGLDEHGIVRFKTLGDT